MTDDPQAHLDGLQAWLESCAASLKHQPTLSSEERKQLVEVEKTIQKLMRLGVTIPDDLRNMKLRLSAKDHAGPSDKTVESELGQIDELIEGLAELTKQGKRLRSGIRRSDRSGGTKRHYGVSIKELLESGELSTSDKLELQWLKSGPRIKGKLLEDGQVKVLSGEHAGNYRSLSAAADACAGRSLNGWDHWRRINDDGSKRPLTEIRAEYLKRKLNPALNP